MQLDVLIINSPNDEMVSSIPNDAAFPPLGIIILGTYLSENNPALSIEVLDGQVVGHSRILELIAERSPRVLAVSCLSASYRNAIEYCTAAKKNGACTVLGNDHAAIFTSKILERQSCVDYAFVGDQGEHYFPAAIELLLARGSESISKKMHQLGFWSMESLSEFSKADIGKVEISRLRKNELGHLLPNRRLLSSRHWRHYGQIYDETYGFRNALHEQTTTTISHARGCARKKYPCAFCGIIDLLPRFSDPELFWKDIQIAYDDISATVFYDTFDSFTSSKRWISQLISSRPYLDFDYEMIVYAQAVETNHEMAELLSKLGVGRVNMGLESGDDTSLRRLKGKQDSVEKNRSAVLALDKRNIQIYSSLVLGAPGETEASLKNTIEFAKWLVDHGFAAALQAQPLFPDMAARTGKVLSDVGSAKEALAEWEIKICPADLVGEFSDILDSDCPDPNLLSRMWAEALTCVGWDAIIDAANEIMQYAQQHGVPSGAARLKALPTQAPTYPT